MADKLAALQHSRGRQFVQKLMDDRVPNLAILLAWGTLNTLLPLILGMLAIAGFVLRDPKRLDQLTGMLFGLLPGEAATTLSEIVKHSRESAGAAGIISLLILLFSGTNFFANMQMVFNLAYHVQDRNLVMQRVMALVMLFIVTALLLVSTTAYGFGNLIRTLPIGLPVGPLLGLVIGWSISILSAIVMFLLLYKILPNARQSWRQVLPGSLTAAVLFFVILQVFPLYLAIFGKGFAAYQAFGIFLVLMFWLFLLGLVLVVGAELNAFLEAPGRSTALAASKARAEKGQVEMRRASGEVETQATGTAAAGVAEGGSADGQPRPRAAQASRPAAPAAGAARPASIAGKLLGLLGLTAAVLLLRGHQPTPEASTGPR